MGGKQDDLTGRLKEAVGDVADESLEREGHNDRASGAAKGKLDDAQDGAEETDDIRDAANNRD